MPDFHIYMLRCNDGSYYVGHTDNLTKRLSEHQSGSMACYTTDRLPVSLVWSQPCPSREEAIVAEHKIKRWTRRKKEALIDGNWQKLSELAKKQF